MFLTTTRISYSRAITCTSWSRSTFNETLLALDFEIGIQTFKIIKSGSVWFSLADRVSPTSVSGLFWIFFWMRGSSSLLDRWVFFALASRFRELRHLVHSVNKNRCKAEQLKTRIWFPSILKRIVDSPSFQNCVLLTCIFFVQAETCFKTDNLTKKKVYRVVHSSLLLRASIFVAADISFLPLLPTVVHQKHANNSNEFSHKNTTKEKVSILYQAVQNSHKYL